ncbi:low molecular weight phosphatase family protein [Bacillus xiapuensis]|uniref:hypothetical protein n=1 Tax=Bacillus xiapuensis TaxID=2014075 RepID=UPI000C24CEDC|nr:hypothetical protein [Bacillus xiapuensis]
MKKKHILFLSPTYHLSMMAVGWASKLHDPSLKFTSAFFLHARADDHFPIQAMKEVNINISAQTTKPVALPLIQQADVLVLIYDFELDQPPRVPEAADQRILHWHVSNPQHYSTAIEQWAAYQIVCDQLATHMKNFKKKAK